ncbi:AGAP007668-PA-like protein [Anopheles sinensis]|uniref:AGAP007668-PA-like protein n=1 Tax=Anopheles sinensis TaxID=74873 RepID=A0A084VF01_ANOSI|nr:AGAP007668-PA-like protein [Anopheles sinensis]
MFPNRQRLDTKDIVKRKTCEGQSIGHRCQYVTETTQRCSRRNKRSFVHTVPVTTTSSEPEKYVPPHIKEDQTKVLGPYGCDNLLLGSYRMAHGSES